MASTIIVDQKGKPIGKIYGFANFVKAFIDENGVPWLPITGEAFHDMSQLLAHKINLADSLQRDNALLQKQLNEALNDGA